MGTPQARAEGNLTKTPFAHLLVYMERHKLTGTLVVWPEQEGDGSSPEVGSGQVRVRFDGGLPIAARVPKPVESLGAALLPLFLRGSSPYAFYEADLMGSAEALTRGRLDPMRLLGHALHKHTRDAVVDSVLRRFGKTPLRLKPGVSLDRLGLETQERGFIDALRAEPAEVATLVAQSGLPEARARRILYLLAITRSVEGFSPEAGAGPSRRSNSGPSPPARPSQDVARRSLATARRIRRMSMRTDAGAPLSRPTSLQPQTLPSPKPPSGLSRALHEQWQQIIDKYNAIEHQNYFGMLGIDPSADENAVRSAYFQLAKRWHPDRLPSELEAVRGQVERVFSLLTEAHGCLSDSRERARYENSIKEGGGTPAEARLVNAIMEAAVQYQKVEVLARRKVYAEALQLLDDVLELHADEADYHAMRAWLLLQRHPGDQAPLARILRTTTRALQLHPKHERAHLCRALTLQRMGKEDEALAAFRRTLEINPRNVEAGRQVRLAQMRKGRDKTPAVNGGLLSRLFGRK